MNIEPKNDFALNLGKTIGFLNATDVREFLIKEGIDPHIIDATVLQLKAIAHVFYKYKAKI